MPSLDQEASNSCCRWNCSTHAVRLASCSRAHLAVFPDNLRLLTAFITASTLSTTRSRLRWLTHHECLSRAAVLLSRSSIIHGIDFLFFFACVEYYMVFTFPRIIQQGKQIVFFGSKVNINCIRNSICRLSLMESDFSLACVWKGL